MFEKYNQSPLKRLPMDENLLSEYTSMMTYWEKNGFCVKDYIELEKNRSIYQNQIDLEFSKMLEERIASIDLKILTEDKMLPLVAEVATYHAAYVSVYDQDFKLIDLPNGFQYGNYEFLSSLIYDEQDIILNYASQLDMDYDEFLFEILSQIIMQFKSDFEKLMGDISISIDFNFKVHDKIREICDHKVKVYYRKQIEVEFENRKRYSDIAVDYTKKQLWLFWITIIYVFFLLYILVNPSNPPLFKG